MRTARGLGWELIGKKHNRFMPRRFKKSSHAINAARKQAQTRNGRNIRMREIATLKSAINRAVA